MKRTLLPHHNIHSRKIACTVSAAALMLGVSQAATIGFNIQANYCTAASYSGAIVTAQAFGIAPSGWQNLTPLQTGYGCGSCNFVNLNEVINTTTATDGLNPLPNGSITVNWGGPASNVSGFGGYGRSGPHYTFGGNNEQPGNEQVYWGFIRDGVNFGPSPSASCSGASDNNQPGYSIDITGLKSVFTNTPFAVELIASSDSLWGLTNAFIIDATANTTQSVIYPNIPTPADQGGDLNGGGKFPRGIGGGLSTGSGSVNTDHLKIIGNRAQHGVGFNLASTISGFIITDKPVISMSPQPVVVAGGDTVTWSGYAVGVPPLSYQWRKNGTPIPGATTSSLSIANVSLGDAGTYDLRVTNLYGTAISSPVTVDEILTAKIDNLVLDSKPSGQEHDGLNTSASWLASSTDGANVTRSGVMSFITNTPNQITIPPDASFNSSTGTISFWMRSSGIADPSGKPATLFDRMDATTGAVIFQNADGTVTFEARSATIAAGLVTTTNVLSDNKWHQVTVVFDQQTGGPFTGELSIYVDGQFDSTSAVFLDWAWPTNQIELGLSHDTASWQAYQGLMDDVRVYNRVLTDPEITSLHTGAIVDANALVMRLDFTAAPGQGITLRWQAGDAVLQSADSVTGPYTDITGAGSPYSVSVLKSAKFYRYRGHTPVTIVSNPYLM